MRWYGKPHGNPEWLGRFVYGLPELAPRSHRSHRSTSAASGVTRRRPRWRSGRSLRQGLVDSEPECDLRSEGRQQRRRQQVQRCHASPGAGARHAQLCADGPPAYGGSPTGAARSRRRTPDVYLSATAVDNVRGVLATAHVFVQRRRRRSETSIEPTAASIEMSRSCVWSRNVPACIAIRNRRSSAGSNYADVGFALEDESRPCRRHRCHRQPDERRSGHGRAVHEPDVRLGRDDRASAFPDCIRFRTPPALCGNDRQTHEGRSRMIVVKVGGGKDLNVAGHRRRHRCAADGRASR